MKDKRKHPPLFFCFYEKNVQEDRNYFQAVPGEEVLTPPPIRPASLTYIHLYTYRDLSPTPSPPPEKNYTLVHIPF